MGASPLSLVETVRMRLSIYVIVAPSADRPYVSTTPPSEERATRLRENGSKIFRVDVDLPEGYPLDRILEATAEKVH